MKRKIFKLLLLAPLVSMLALASCIREEVIDNPSPTGEATVTFALRVPGNSAPATRAMDDAAEYKVNTIEVVAFKEGKFSYWTSAAATLKSGNNTYEATLKLVQGTGYDLVIFANSKGVISGVSSSMKGTTTKDATLKLFTKSVTDKWNAATGASEAFPMSSDPGLAALTGKTIDENTTFSTVDLYRMTARVQVGLASGVESKFELEEIWVYNRNTTGYVVGDRSGAGADPSVVNAYASRVTPVTGNAATKLIYEGSELSATACEREIYLFEVANPHPASAKPSDERPCLVVGGKYNGQSGYYRVDFHDGTQFLDVLRNHSYNIMVTDVTGIGFEDVDDAFAAGPVNIEANVLQWDDSQMDDVVFNGQNYMSISPSWFELYRNAKTGLSFTVKTDYAQGWTFAGVTDAPTGGTAVTWIKNVLPISGAGDETRQTVTFNVELNDTEAERTAYIHIKAGRLEFPVAVTQNTEGELALSVLNETGTSEISELVFWSSGDTPTQPAAQSFTLRWVPDTENVSIATMSAGTGASFDFDGTAGYFNASTSSATGGSRTFTLQPTVIDITGNPFAERLSLVNISLSSQGRSTSKSLFLRQVHYNLIPQSGTFLMDGTQQEFRVLANFQWKVEFVSATRDDETTDSDKIKKTFAVQYGGNNTDTGDPVKFTCFDYISTYDVENPEKGTIMMKFSRLDPVAGWVDWNIYEITVYAAVPVGESNCYMIDNAKPVPIMIPVSQLQYAMNGDAGTGSGFLGTTWLSGEENFRKLQAQILWSDVNEFDTDDAVVKVITYNGATSVADGKIVVVPGNGKGNAGIILYDDTNSSGTYNSGEKIYWSWHIWKTDYFPYEDDTYPSTNPMPKSTTESGGVWMDRNIGAVTNAYATANPQQVAGFLYQWGRKDPLPSINLWNEYFTNYLYYAPESDITFREIQNTENINLTNSVMNPMTHYWRSGLPNDWFTNTTANQNNDLWGGGVERDFLHPAGIDGYRKSVYDPCPEGYRVPEKDDWMSTGWETSTNGKSHAGFGGVLSRYWTQKRQ